MAKTSTKVVSKVVSKPAAPEEAPEFEAEVIEDLTITVPGAKRAPIGNMQGGMYWIYGMEKIGKTTFGSKFPGAWFWSTEPGQKWVEVYEPQIIHSWDHFLQICQYVVENKPTKFGDGKPIKTIVIDTVDLLYKLCEAHVTEQLGVDTLFDNDDRGKGWNRLASEFERVITKMRRWPFTLVCISHARQKPFKTKGRQVDRMEPDIGAGARRVLSAAADLILYAHAEDRVTYNDEGEPVGTQEVRQLLCHPTASALAGGRMSHLLPKTLPLDYEELNAYLTGKKTVGEEE